MVWRKIIIFIMLPLTLATLAARVSAAEDETIPAEMEIPVMGSVGFEAVEYIRAYLNAHPLDPELDYMLFSSDITSNNCYVWVVGSINQNGTMYSIAVDQMYLLQTGPGNSWYFYPFDGISTLFVDNSQCFFLYSNIGDNLILYDRSDVYAFTALLFLGTGVCCYLLRSIFGFSLRRRN